MIRRALRRRFMIAALAALAIGAIAGVTTAVLLPGRQTITTPGAEAEVVNAPDGQTLIVVQRAGERVSFPPDLSGLDVSPEKLAVDPGGSVWIPLFSGADSGHLLYRYNPLDGKVDAFTLPDNPATGMSSAIAVSPTGQVVLAYGGLVAVLDPETGAFTKYDVPLDSPNYSRFGVDEGTYVTDMDMGPDDLVYVTRMNIAAVTAVDLTTGAIGELPVSGASGPLFDVGVLGTDVYVANWIHGKDLYDASSGGTRVVRLSSDGTQGTLEGSARALAGDTDRMYTLDLKGEVRAYKDRLLAVAPETQVMEAAIDGTLAVDSRTGDVWVSGREADSVTRWDANSKSLTRYQLPVYEVPGHLIRCPATVECKDQVMHTAVGGLAVAPNGDVYFSDATMHRIGVISVAQ